MSFRALKNSVIKLNGFVGVIVCASTRCRNSSIARRGIRRPVMISFWDAAMESEPACKTVASVSSRKSRNHLDNVERPGAAVQPSLCRIIG
jgi:hypothetical protein